MVRRNKPLLFEVDEEAAADGAVIVQSKDEEAPEAAEDGEVVAGGRPAPPSVIESRTNLHDLPIIVMEGLRTPDHSLGENNDRDVVVAELKKVMPPVSDFTEASVIKAIRMPFKSTGGRSVF